MFFGFGFGFGDGFGSTALFARFGVGIVVLLVILIGFFSVTFAIFPLRLLLFLRLLRFRFVRLLLIGFLTSTLRSTRIGDELLSFFALLHFLSSPPPSYRPRSFWVDIVSQCHHLASRYRYPLSSAILPRSICSDAFAICLGLFYRCCIHQHAFCILKP